LIQCEIEEDGGVETSRNVGANKTRLLARMLLSDS